MEDHKRVSASELLDIRALNTVYGDTPILQGVSVTVKQGQIIGIVGESGSGKSTVIYSTLGLLGKGGRVTAGEIFYDGLNLRELSKAELRRLRGEELSLIAQYPLDSFHPIRKIGQELKLFVKAHKTVSYKEAEAEMLRLMKKFGLKDGKEILGKYAFELSGGMCQRTAIALAMVRCPKILFADEPTSALDVTVQKQVVDEMLRIREESGTSVVIVSHNIGVISYMADEIYVMYAGHVLEHGKTVEVIQNAVHPYTQHLVRVIPRMNQPPIRNVNMTKKARTDIGCPYRENCPEKTKRCEEEIPPIRKISEEHYVRCWKL